MANFRRGQKRNSAIMILMIVICLFLCNKGKSYFALQECQKKPEECILEQTMNNLYTGKVLPCGIPIGLYLETQGILVIDIADIMDYFGNIASPSKNLLMSGDYIIFINGNKLEKKEELLTFLEENGDKEVCITVNRASKELSFNIKPVMNAEGNYQLGIWVRDDCQGIGTLTFVTEGGVFGALGHGINDYDIGSLVEADGGVIRRAQIYSVIQGRKGLPGSLVGSIRNREEDILGYISENTTEGVYGLGNQKLITEIERMYGDQNLSDSYISVARPEEIKKGRAYIRSSLSGTLEDYEISIVSINRNKDNNKGITFQVTDERLLEITGGIVQGMSGSPIIQNNLLIGAVTHVFVQDATKGYGIFIERMLKK